METKLYGEIAPGGKWAPLLLLLAIALYVPVLWTYPLSDAESKYAEIPREMLEQNDWITPRIDYVPYLTKPPLSFWATMIAYKVGGVSEFTSRLPNVVFALALAFVVGAIGRTLFGTRAATIATILCLTTVEFYNYTRECGVEMALLFFIALTHHCFLRWQRTEKRKWLAGAWASAGLAVLAKGPMGIAFPAFSIFLYLLVTGQRAQFRRLFSWRGVPVFLAIVLPWPIAMEMRHPGFLQNALVNETWKRFLGTKLPKEALFPTGLFLALCMGEFYPWVQQLPHAFARGLREAWRKTYEGHCVVYLLCWSLLPLVVFSLSRSKVDFYGLHAQPGLILLVAWLWEKRFAGGDSAPSKGWMASTWLLSAIGAAVCMVLLAMHPEWPEEIDLKTWMAWSFLIAALGANAVAGIGTLQGKLRLSLGAVSALMLVFFFISYKQFEARTESDSMYFATVAFNSATGQKCLVSAERPEFAHVATLAFYAKRQCFLLRNAKDSQLVFESDDPRTACVIDETGVKDSLLAKVHEGFDVFLVGDAPATGERLDRLGLRYTKQTESGGRALYRIRGKKQ